MIKIRKRDREGKKQREREINREREIDREIKKWINTMIRSDKERYKYRDIIKDKMIKIGRE